MDKLKGQIIDAGVRLCEEGLIARTWGNVSGRVSDDKFAITASGKEYHNLGEDDVVVLDMKDLSYKGNVKPSGEKKVHQVIYIEKPEAGFVIHTHQSNGSAVAAMGLKKIKLPRTYPGIGDTIYCADYGLPGSKAVARNVLKCIKQTDSKAILMANHGAVCYGRDSDEAFQIVRALEEACGQVLMDLGIRPQGISPQSISHQGHVNDDCLIKWPRNKIGVYLDDFAQLIGPSLNMRNYNPEKLSHKLGEDIDAVKMVVEKNCRAGLAAIVTNGKPINFAESVYMRYVYLRSYSKIK